MREIAVATFPNELEARLAAQRLEAAGIRSVLVPLGGGPGIWGTATMLPTRCACWRRTASARAGCSATTRASGPRRADPTDTAGS